MLADFRFALRQLAKTPGFAAVAILSLALGIGANTTVLSWIQHVLRRPLPGVEHQEQIVALVSREGGGNISLLDSRDLDDLHEVFAGVAVSQITPASLVLGRDTGWTYGQIVSANFFSLLGVRPILGRTFLADEDRKPGGNPVLVLGEKLWRRRFAADPDVVGRVVDLNRHKFTVIGVVPAAFPGSMTGVACEFWTPVSMVHEVASWPSDYITWRGSRPFHNVVRLRPGVTLLQAQAAVDALSTRLAEAYPRSNRDTHYRLVRYADAPFGAQSLLGPALRLLLAVSLGVLLIVAANVANLLLARAASRQKEIAIRVASGASRSRIVRMLLTESIVLALLGGVAGALLASWTVDSIATFLPAGQLPISLGHGLDGATLGLTLALTLATGLVFGLVPALQVSRPQLYAILKEGGRTSAGGASHHRLRNILVVAEIALALILVVSASLCMKGLSRARQVDFGFDPAHVLTSGLQIGMNGYTEQTAPAFYRQLQERLAALPEVETAALASWFPLGLEGCKGHGVEVNGYNRPEGENAAVDYARISPDYFAAMRTPLVAGRDFTSADDSAAPAVAIVNEAFAQRYWPGVDALGRKFRCAGRERTIIGIAQAGKYRALDEPAHPFFYLPYMQGAPELDLGLCLRVKGDPAALVETVRQTVRSLDPGVDLWNARPLTMHIQGAFFAARIASSLLTALGVVALLLAAMGVYAVMAFAVGQRTQEFGVRMALGARPRDVIWQVLRRGLVLAAIGTALGLVGAGLVTRLLAGFLYGVSPFDPLTFTAVPALLVLIAALACWLPARRATRVDPMVTLRAD